MTGKEWTDELIRMYGDELRAMDHPAYAQLATDACPESPARESSVRNARLDPQRRFSNVIRGRLLRYMHQQATGLGAEVDTGGLQLF